MRIYVAAAYAERNRAAEVMSLMRENGHTITYDWTTNEQESAEQASADFQGVVTADALVFLAEKPYVSTGGAMVEFGAALACKLPVYVIGSGIDRCIFTKLPTCIYRGIGPLLRKTI